MENELAHLKCIKVSPADLVSFCCLYYRDTEVQMKCTRSVNEHLSTMELQQWRLDVCSQVVSWVQVDFKEQSQVCRGATIPTTQL